MSLQVLLVEDNLDLAATIFDYLTIESIGCDHAANGVAGLTFATENRYDVLLLDVNLPRMDGLLLCQKLRQDGIDTPVLMLTARDSLDDKLAGFNAGTDDYLVKPFALEELFVRIKSLAGRRSGQVTTLSIADLEIDLQQREARRAGKVLQLTPSTWTILKTLMYKSPEVISRQDLEHALWPDDGPPDSNTLKVHFHKLRQQVDKPFVKKLIKTVPGHGFLIKADDE